MFYAVYLGTRRFVFVYVRAQMSPHVVLAVRLTLLQWTRTELVYVWLQLNAAMPINLLAFER